MFKKYPTLLALLSLLMIACNEHAVKESLWPEQSMTTKPWTRWWWMGSAVDEVNITSLLSQYAEKGIGGVEITPIYGAKGFEDTYLEFLSEEWMEGLYTVIRVADSLGMGVDMNLGTGWPYGGPHIEPELAATKMVVQTYTLSKGERLKEKIAVADEKQVALGVGLKVLMGYKGEASTDLTPLVNADGMLDWVADGNYELYAVFTGKTRQQVKRAAPGGKGYVMDHLNVEALKAHTQRFEQAYRENTPSIRSYFNDSYEVYGADFTDQYFEAFEQLRGYDLKPFLPEILRKDSSDRALRIKADYRKTMGELLLTNFTNPWKEWANAKGAKTRNQAHGSPANLLDVYAAVDIPECETFGWTDFEITGRKVYTETSRHTPPDPFMLKMAASSANVLGKPLVSSETFTWLGEHFKVPLSLTKPELDQAFLSGVNHVFYHGTTYSPDEAGWPGWLFYASTNFAPSNSFWGHIDGLNAYISRCQSILQAGKPQGDVLLYFPYEDMVYEAGKNMLEYLFTVHNIPEWLWPTDFYALAKALTAAGYTVDYLSDDLLAKLEWQEGRLTVAGSGTEYKSLVIPAMRFMSQSTLKKIKNLQASGAQVIFQELPEDVPGWNDLESRRSEFRSWRSQLASEVEVSSDVVKTLTSKRILGEQVASQGLKYIRRKLNDEVYYFLANQTSNDFDGFVLLNSGIGKANDAVLMDPLTGRAGNAQTSLSNVNTEVKIQLKSGQSIFVKVGGKQATSDWRYFSTPSNVLSIDGPWEVQFLTGGPSIPKSQKIDKTGFWTNLGEEEANFSGTVSYTSGLNLDKVGGAEYVLDLGDVRESAKVWINGVYAGVSWSTPHELEIGQYLKDGANEIKIEVANLMANRIRYMDQQGIAWKKYHEINFVNIDYQHFDASNCEVQPSGLGGEVRLFEMK